MYKVSISGSWNRHLALIRHAELEFRECGCDILSPKNTTIVDAVGDFLFVESDVHRSIKLIENRHLLAIANSDFLWLVSPDGYTGLSASLEIGYAVAKGVPIYCELPHPDLTMSKYLKIASTPIQAIGDYQRYRYDKQLNQNNLLLDPIAAAREAHNLIDQITYLLSQPALVKSADLEKRITMITQQLNNLINVGLTS